MLKPIRPLGPSRAAKLPALLQRLIERLAEMPEKAAIEITWGTDDVTVKRTDVLERLQWNEIIPPR